MKWLRLLAVGALLMSGCESDEGGDAASIDEGNWLVDYDGGLYGGELFTVSDVSHGSFMVTVNTDKSTRARIEGDQVSWVLDWEGGATWSYSGTLKDSRTIVNGVRRVQHPYVDESYSFTAYKQ